MAVDKLLDLEIFRGNSKLLLRPWPEQRRVILELTPTLPDAPKGQPEKGSHKFDYDKKLTIGFTPNGDSGMLQSAFNLLCLLNGTSEKFVKYADLSKSEAAGDDKKTLNVSPDGKGDFFLSLQVGKDKVSTKIGKADIWAIAKYLELVFDTFLKMSFVKEEDAN